MDRADRPWSNVHELRVFRQVQQRRMDSGWIETLPTGQALALCNCGFTTGWVDQDQMPDRAALVAEHGVPHRSVMD
jgi:hypothetical protein